MYASGELEAIRKSVIIAIVSEFEDPDFHDRTRVHGLPTVPAAVRVFSFVDPVPDRFLDVERYVDLVVHLGGYLAATRADVAHRRVDHGVHQQCECRALGLRQVCQQFGGDQCLVYPLPLILEFAVLYLSCSHSSHSSCKFRRSSSKAA